MKTRNKNHHNLRNEKNKKEQRQSGKAGLPPGSLVHIGKTLTDTISLSITDYNAAELKRKKVDKIDMAGLVADSVHRWIEINGLHDTPVMENIGKTLGINMLVMEDIVNTEHRPKFEIQEDFLFLTLKGFSVNENNQISIEQLSFVLSKNFLVTFQESNFPWFEAVRTRMENPAGKIRQSGLDFLLYSLIDVIVDHYYAMAETIGDQLEDLEDRIFENPSQELLEKNRLIKKEIISIRKLLLPALEAINKLNRFKPEILHRDVLRYFDDVDDHLVQVIDYMDTYRDLSAELKENYLSNISFKMAQIMKLLTIITTIFIPLSFVAGVYGMNFHNMPELSWKYGYFGVLGLMFCMTVAMLIYFRKKKWM
jgi:magnesium transporter